VISRDQKLGGPLKSPGELYFTLVLFSGSRSADLGRRVGDDSSRERLTSILNNIAGYVSQFIRDLHAEFSDFPARIDLTNLTIVFDRPERSVPMGKTGGGENHLTYHLSTLLALHLFAVKSSRPLPRFL
jgi:hypothetical protein